MIIFSFITIIVLTAFFLLIIHLQSEIIKGHENRYEKCKKQKEKMKKSNKVNPQIKENQ